MIITTLDSLSMYEQLIPHVDEIAGLISEMDRTFEDLPGGRVDLGREDMFAVLVSTDLDGSVSPVLEAHRTFLDIQYVRTGREVIGWKPLADHCSAKGYDADSDVELFDDLACDTLFSLQKGQLAILYPHDLHAPMSGTGRVEKVILKIRL